MSTLSDRILAEILTFLKSLDHPDRHGPATLLYNEGWLLRLVLSAAVRGIRCLPDAFEPGARWFTEALLYTPFAARTRGDKLAESVTHADGVIGHFDVGKSSRAGIHLANDASQFVICEAKMFSGLSARTTRAPGYDQAARNVGCLAWTLSNAHRTPDSFRSLGFWLLAPQAQIGSNVFACVTRESIEDKIRHRIAEYDEHWRRTTLEPWFNDAVLPVLDRLQLSCLTWEQVIDDIVNGDAEFGTALRDFYSSCLIFSRTQIPQNER